MPLSPAMPSRRQATIEIINSFSVLSRQSRLAARERRRLLYRQRERRCVPPLDAEPPFDADSEYRTFPRRPSAIFHAISHEIIDIFDVRLGWREEGFDRAERAAGRRASSPPHAPFCRRMSARAITITITEHTIVTAARSGYRRCRCNRLLASLALASHQRAASARRARPHAGRPAPLRPRRQIHAQLPLDLRGAGAYVSTYRRALPTRHHTTGRAAKDDALSLLSLILSIKIRRAPLI